MEMGKLTAKLRDAVPVCLLVDDKEIKRYKNIDIPEELKKLEYQDFKFDVPLNGSITFKIMFEPGILPEEFPQTRVRKTRVPKEVPEAVVNKTLMTTTVEGDTKATLVTTTSIAIQDDIVEEIPEAILQASDEEATMKDIEEAKHEVEAEAKEPKPAKNIAAKPKKARATTKSI